MISERKKSNKSFICFWFVLVSSIGIIGEVFAKCPVRMGSEFPPKDFLVLAHRGAADQFPDNTIPAFQQALNDKGANALQVDLSFTKDQEVIFWHDWDPNDAIALIRQEGREPIVKFKPFAPSKDSRWRKKVSDLSLIELRNHYGFVDIETNVKSDTTIPTLKEFMEWANRQDNLKLVLFKLRIPAAESRLAFIMLEGIQKTVEQMNHEPKFQMVFSTPHKEILHLVKKDYSHFSFSYDREIPAKGVVNYDRFTTIPTARDLKNQFASIGLPINEIPSKSIKPDPWVVYRFILTRDFKLRDNNKKRGSDYIKILSWNFNDEKKMECLIRLGVDGIVTDKPKLLRRIALKLGKDLDF
jgi:glycerophosphoryl diester phosphodiesterase